MLAVNCKLFTAAVEDYSRLGCLFLIVLTHGDDNHLYGTDGHTIKYEEFLYPIREASISYLQGIPKILLVQVGHYFTILPALEVHFTTLWLP